VSGDVHLRPAVETDAEAIGAMHADETWAFFARPGDPPTLDEIRQTIVGGTGDPHRLRRTVVVDGVFAGQVSLDLEIDVDVQRSCDQAADQAGRVRDRETSAPDDAGGVLRHGGTRVGRDAHVASAAAKRGIRALRGDRLSSTSSSAERRRRWDLPPMT
jgi:hypothetical protein